MAPEAICLGHRRCGAATSRDRLFYSGLGEKPGAHSWNKPLHFDLYLFDKLLSLVGTGLEVRLNVKGTVKW